MQMVLENFQHTEAQNDVLKLFNLYMKQSPKRLRCVAITSYKTSLHKEAITSRHFCTRKGYFNYQCGHQLLFCQVITHFQHKSLLK